MLLSNRRRPEVFRRVAGVMLAFALIAVALCPAMAQEIDQDAPNANEFVTALSEFNALAMEQSLQVTESTSHALISDLDALRASSHVAVFESGERAAVRNANEYVTYLEGLRSMESMPMVAIVSQ